MTEHIYRSSTGYLVLVGIRQVGIRETVPLHDIYYQKMHGAIEGHPEEIHDDIFLGAMRSRK